MGLCFDLLFQIGQAINDFNQRFMNSFKSLTVTLIGIAGKRFERLDIIGKLRSNRRVVLRTMLEYMRNGCFCRFACCIQNSFTIVSDGALNGIGAASIRPVRLKAC
ncbi:hypothetical protein HGG75_15425 [Ochrobactrum pseudogrignonense]|nr:hypothetical protein [Brucella pseudogrignonensis]